MSETSISLTGKSTITVGRFTYGKNNIDIKQWNEGAALTIGAFCSIAENVQVFLGGNHRTDWITTFPFGHIHHGELGGKDIEGHPATKGDVTIGNDVWIGTGTTIMSGVTIGDGAVIGANATVVKDVNPYEIVGGNPAKHLKYRFSKEIIALLLELQWWKLPVENIRKIAPDLCAAPTVSKLKKLLKEAKI